MSDDPQNLEFQVEADATQAVRASNAAAEGLAALVSQANTFEAALRGIFTGTLPEGLAQLREYAALIKQVEKLPANLRDVSRVAGQLQTGGPAAALQRATFQGALQNMRNDPAVQRLQYEKDANKVLEARRQIYTQLRDTMPEDATLRQRSSTYQKGLSELGMQPDNERSLAEVKAFEADISQVKLAALQKQAEAENKQVDATEQMRLGRLRQRFAAEQTARETESKAAVSATEKDNALKLDMLNRRMKIEKSQRDAADAAQDRRTKANAKANTDAMYSAADAENRRYDQLQRNTPEAMAANSQQRVRQNVSDRQARLDYQGGSAMFGVEAHTMANYAIMGAGIGAAGATGKEVIDLDNALKSLQGTAGLTNNEMTLLAKTIMSVGSDSNQSLTEIADGTTELIKAGYSVVEVAGMIKPINDLAVATRTSFKEASDVATSSLKLFGLSAQHTQNIVDTLAELATKTKIPIDELGKAFESVGEVAKGSNVQFEEVAAGFQVMANAGLKSSAQLGTGMKMLIEQLDTPSAKLQAQLAKVGLSAADVDVKTNGLAGSLENMAHAGFSNSEALAGMNVRAAQAYVALSQNIEGFKNLTTTITQNNTAAKIAGTQMESMESQAKRLGNATSALAYTGLTPTLHALTGMVSALASVAAGAGKLAPVMALVGTAGASMLIVKIVEWLGGMALGAITAGTALEGLTIKQQMSAVASQLATASFEEMAVAARTAAVAFITNPMVLATIALTALIGALTAYSWAQDQAAQRAQEYAAKADEASQRTKVFTDRIVEIDGYVEMLTERHARLTTNTQEAGAAALIAAQKFGTWGLQIDKNIGQVDTLIGRLVELRRQQAASALEAAKQQKTALQGQNAVLTGQFNGSTSQAATMAKQLIQHGSSGTFGAVYNQLKAAGLLPTMQKIASGQETAEGVQADLATLRTKGGGISNPYFSGVVSHLDNSAVPAASIAGNNAAMSQQDVAISDYTMQSSGAGAQFNAQTSALRSQFIDGMHKAQAIKDPRARAAAVEAEASRQKAALATFNAGVDKTIDAKLQDPQYAAGIRVAAQESGRSMHDEARAQLSASNPGDAALQAVVGGSDTTNPKLLADQATRYKALAQNAKRMGNASLYKKYSDLASHSTEQAKAQRDAADPNFDPLTAAQDEDAVAGANDARTSGGVAGIDKKNAAAGAAAAKRAQKLAAENQGATADDLKTQIDNMVTNAGPTPDAIMEQQPQLQKLLDQWKSAKVNEAQLTPKDADSAAEMKKLNDEIAAYVNKTLKGNIEAAKNMLADEAKANAESTKSQLETQLEFHGGDLDKSVADVATKYLEAQNAAIAASDAKFAKENPTLDPTTSGAAIIARNKIIQAGAKTAIDAQLAIIEAWTKGETQRTGAQLGASNRPLEAQSAQIQAMSNPWGQQHLGDTHRYMGTLADHSIQVQMATNSVASLTSQLGVNQQAAAQTKTLADKEPDGSDKDTALKAWAAAQEEVKKTETSLAKAKDDLIALNAQAQPFVSASEAIAASWTKWIDSSGANKGGLEMLADGLTSTLDSASGSLTKFFGDLEAGSARGKNAFRDLATSMLQSMLGTLNQLMANQMMKMLLSGIGGSVDGAGKVSFGAGGAGNIFSGIASLFGGGASNAGLSSLGDQLALAPLGAAQGWISPRHYALGSDGVPNANRDSVHALLMPGEGVLNRSAMDMVGRDQVQRMNSWGNRTQSQSLPQALSARKPDMTNVYVVAPTAKPQLGKNDVLQVISDDILTGGQTKKLVKAVATGAL